MGSAYHTIDLVNRYTGRDKVSNLQIWHMQLNRACNAHHCDCEKNWLDNYSRHGSGPLQSNAIDVNVDKRVCQGEACTCQSRRRWRKLLCLLRCQKESHSSGYPWAGISQWRSWAAPSSALDFAFAGRWTKDHRLRDRHSDAQYHISQQQASRSLYRIPRGAERLQDHQPRSVARFWKIHSGSKLHANMSNPCPKVIATLNLPAFISRHSPARSIVSVTTRHFSRCKSFKKT